MWHSRKTTIFLAGIFMVGVFVVGCAGGASHQQQHDEVLPPSANADPAAGRAVIKGNELFVQGRWIGAKQQYETAIQIQPTLAEAHYNLAVILNHEGRFQEARPHYIQAANLAPGNTVIWNAPPFRKYGTVEPAAPEPAPDGHVGHQH